MNLSIIVPVYNVAPFISACLEPLTALQNLSYEVIIVDDGSPDDSLEIVSRFRDRLPLKIITQENQGLSAARNSGLKVAQGEYIYFYDSDDFIVTSEFSQLIQECIKNKLDIGAGQGKIYLEDGSTKGLKKKISQEVLIKDGPSLFMILNKTNHYSPMVWLRIYRHEFLKKHDLSFTAGIIHEDEEFTAKCYCYAERAGQFTNDFYRYRYREGSISKGKKHKYENAKSLPSFIKIANHLSQLKTLSTDQKKVLDTTIGKIYIEILRRLQYQKKNKYIENIPSWNTLDLTDSYQKLSLLSRFKILRIRLKMLIGG